MIRPPLRPGIDVLALMPTKLTLMGKGSVVALSSARLLQHRPFLIVQAFHPPVAALEAEVHQRVTMKAIWHLIATAGRYVHAFQARNMHHSWR